jgi:preprotein translocase subunit SecY
MDLSNLKPAKGSTKNRKRIGRGQGSGKGGTSTRGHKGAQSRSGYSRKPGFEGGQMPLYRRVPKFGFKNINRVEYHGINVDTLQKLAEEKKLSSIDQEVLVKNGLASKKDLIKILGRGELTVKLEVKAHAFSEKAISAIEAQGGVAIKLIQTIRNIYKIEELRNRILYTIGIVLIYRLGSYVVLPGVNPSELAALQSQTSSGLLGLLNMFSGGAFSNASIFALGIMPYISASIVVQLLGMALPYFQKLQKEGESGRKKINQITRYLTILITGFQAQAYIANLVSQLRNPDGSITAIMPFAGTTVSPFFWLSSTVILISGTMFVMWLGEKITDKGIGNGISLIIMIGIIARLPFALLGEFISRLEEKGGGLVYFVVEIAILVFVILLTILLVQGTRRIPVQYAKRIVGNKQYGGVRQYIPLKVNAAGVMPIIFAQAIMFLPLTVAGFTNADMSGFVAAFSNINGFWYNLVFFFMILLFTYFYTAITINPNQMAEDMKKNGGFIPGVKPGRKTAEFIDNVMSKITLPGSIFLGLVAIMPAFVSLIGVNQQFAQFYGGTSLLILVGVVLDTLQQVESHLLMRHYDGLTKSGRIKGRSSFNM